MATEDTALLMQLNTAKGVLDALDKKCTGIKRKWCSINESLEEVLGGNTLVTLTSRLDSDQKTELLNTIRFRMCAYKVLYYSAVFLASGFFIGAVASAPIVANRSEFQETRFDENEKEYQATNGAGLALMLGAIFGGALGGGWFAMAANKLQKTLSAYEKMASHLRASLGADAVTASRDIADVESSGFRDSAQTESYCCLNFGSRAGS